MSHALTSQCLQDCGRHVRGECVPSPRVTEMIRLCLLLLPLTMAVAVRADDAGPAPNVIVIFADDLGYGELSCYGHPAFATPRLDRMAREGVRFTQWYVPTPFCAPSRGTLLTGQYPWRHGCWNNPAPDAGIDDVGISDEAVTLGEVFQSAGYATTCIGKWHLGHTPQYMPRRHGFDEYFGILYSNDMRPVQLMENEELHEYPVLQATLTRRYTDRAIDFITRNQDRPFFLYLPHAMPHKPLAASEQFYKKSGAGLYGDVIAELDFNVGRLLDALQELDLDERTFVIFTSDNGPWFGGDTGGLRGMKADTWEGGLRVPAIVRMPGRIPPGRVIEDPCASWDLFPTLLALAGIDPPEGRVLDGVDLLPTLIDDADVPDRVLFGMRSNNLLTVRRGRYKLHVVPSRGFRFKGDGAEWIDPRAPDGVTIIAQFEQYNPTDHPGLETGDAAEPMALFDLIADPGEQHNIAERHPEIVRDLKAEYDRMLATIPADQLQPRRRWR
jgi:arylsulfatase A-like enzyme